VTYFNESAEDMTGEEPKNTNIQRLLRSDTSQVSDDDLKRLIASFSIPDEPPRDVEQMATVLAATARAAQDTRSRRRSLSRIAVLSSVGALVVALGGVALAADSAAPGDPMYPIDRALESLGIGAGGVEERIAEFDDLMSAGDEDEAYTLLGEVIEESEGPDLERAQQHLDMAATKSSPSAESAQEKVAELDEYIERYRLPGDAVDGREFGQGVADIATDGAKPDPGPVESGDESPGNSENAPGKQDDETPGNSENAPGQQTDPDPESPPGSSGEAPGRQDGGSPGKPDDLPGQQPGNGSG
jgi:hypothetical protein